MSMVQNSNSQSKLTTKDKINKIESIITFLNKTSYNDAVIYLKEFDIPVHYNDINTSIYLASDDSIKDLYNYIFCQKNIIDFFEIKMNV